MKITKQIQIIKEYIDIKDTISLDICLFKNILFRYEDEIIDYCIRTRNTSILIYFLNNEITVSDIHETGLYLAAYQHHYDILYCLLRARKWSKAVLAGIVSTAGANILRQDPALLDLIYSNDEDEPS
jgi:hypothetical protein